MGRRLIVVLLAVAVLATGSSCSHRSKSDTPLTTDQAGNPIPSGLDWSPGKPGATPAPNPYASLTGKTALDILRRCGVPPTLSPEQEKNFPKGVNPNQPFPKPKNDFVLEAKVTPTKGDRGTIMSIDATAVGQPNALIVVIVHYFDNKAHGAKGAEIADALGHATVKGPVPNDAPVGVATIAVSASTKQSKSAVKMLKFTVTGPGCNYGS